MTADGQCLYLTVYSEYWVIKKYNSSLSTHIFDETTPSRFCWFSHVMFETASLYSVDCTLVYCSSSVWRFFITCWAIPMIAFLQVWTILYVTCIVYVVNEVASFLQGLSQLMGVVRKRTCTRYCTNYYCLTMQYSTV